MKLFASFLLLFALVNHTYGQVPVDTLKSGNIDILVDKRDSTGVRRKLTPKHEYPPYRPYKDEEAYEKHLKTRRQYHQMKRKHK